MPDEMQAPEGSNPEGDGFGKAYVPRPGTTYLAEGAYVRSVIVPEPLQGIVAMDLQGHWNHAAKDVLSVLCTADMAREWGRLLLEAAEAADRDVETWKELHGS